MGRAAKRPSLDRFQDINLRLFVDTNVLIDFVDGINERGSKSFLGLFKKRKFKNIELVTSDYVLWEFYDHYKDELYIKKLISECNYGHVSANKECIRRRFKKAGLKDMQSFGETIAKYEQLFGEDPVNITRLSGKEPEGFGEIVETLRRCSKFSYKDALVFVSAVFTRSSAIVTLDETFSSESHLRELKEALKGIKVKLRLEMDFKKPNDLATKERVEKCYKDWFVKHNRKKQIGKVIRVWPRRNAIGVECIKNFFIEKGDYLCLAKFRRKTDSWTEIFEVKEGNIRDYDTEQEVSSGKKLTIKLPNGQKARLFFKDATVFLYSYS